MTWKEWKAAIEAQGVGDDTEVGKVEVSNDFKPTVKHFDGQAYILNGERSLAELVREANPDEEALTPE